MIGGDILAIQIHRTVDIPPDQMFAIAQEILGDHRTVGSINENIYTLFSHAEGLMNL